MWFLRLLPIGLLRWIASLQFRLPIVGPFLGWVNLNVMAKEGVIRYGHGAGLRFDARGGFAGYLLGTSEPEEQDALHRFLKPDQVFYDIGANVGFFSVLGARFVGPNGRVYAFEPIPACVAKIKKNAAINGFAQIETIETGVSSTTGRARLRVAAATAHSVLAVAGSYDDGHTIDITLTTIDDFVQSRGPRPPNVVMIDVEGAEVEVLKGMHRTLADHRPIVMCEVHWIGDAFLSYCREHLIPLGYRVEPLAGGDFPPSTTRYHAVLTPDSART